MKVGSRIENIMTDRLDLGGLQIERYISKNYTSQINQALIRRLFSIFQREFGEVGINYFSTSHHAACISSSCIISL